MWWVELLNSIVALLESGAGGGGGAYESIATATPTSGSSVTFSSIASTYKHLQLRISFIGSAGATVGLQFNNDTTAANYPAHCLYGNGASAAAAGQTSYGNVPVVAQNPGVGTVATYANVSIVDIHDYASTTKNKTVRAISGGDANGSGYIELDSGMWINTAAISIIKLSVSGGSFATGTTISLYGIKGA